MRKEKDLHLYLVAGARPNFMKIAPLFHTFKEDTSLHVELIHTGQHDSYELSEQFFRDLDLPAPDAFLGAGGGTQAEQTGKVMVAFEKYLQNKPKGLVVVVGDVNSTLAASLVAKKELHKLAHIEAGLRSFDMTMPEEINRVMVDRISDFHLTPSEDAMKNLQNEGIAPFQMTMVGNLMIDSLVKALEKIPRPVENQTVSKGLVTLHRPSNVEDSSRLEAILLALNQVSQNVPLLFPLHPRIEKVISNPKYQALLEGSHIELTKPMGYLDMVRTLRKSPFVITDSGGLQEETTYLRIPCFTLRENTERPVTLSHGTNQLVSPETLVQKVLVPEYRPAPSDPPLGWDGKAAMRTHRFLIQRLSEI